MIIIIIITIKGIAVIWFYVSVYNTRKIKIYTQG